MQPLGPELHKAGEVGLALGICLSKASSGVKPTFALRNAYLVRRRPRKFLGASLGDRDVICAHNARLRTLNLKPSCNLFAGPLGCIARCRGSFGQGGQPLSGDALNCQ